MLNVPKIKGRMREMKWTQESLAKEMGINPTTINYKINNEKGEFLTIEEAEKLKNLLKIPKEELNEYFFTTKLEYPQENEKKRGDKNKNEVL